MAVAKCPVAVRAPLLLMVPENSPAPDSPTRMALWLTEIGAVLTMLPRKVPLSLAPASLATFEIRRPSTPLRAPLLTMSPAKVAPLPVASFDDSNGASACDAAGVGEAARKN